MGARAVCGLAVILALILTTACGTTRTVIQRVEIPVPVPCPAPPVIEPPDLPVLPEAATPAEIQRAMIETIARLMEYAQRLEELLDAYRPEPVPPVPE